MSTSILYWVPLLSSVWDQADLLCQSLVFTSKLGASNPPGSIEPLWKDFTKGFIRPILSTWPGQRSKENLSCPAHTRHHHITAITIHKTTMSYWYKLHEQQSQNSKYERVENGSIIIIIHLFVTTAVFYYKGWEHARSIPSLYHETCWSW